MQPIALETRPVYSAPKTGYKTRFLANQYNQPAFQEFESLELNMPLWHFEIFRTFIFAPA